MNIQSSVASLHGHSQRQKYVPDSQTSHKIINTILKKSKRLHQIFRWAVNCIWDRIYFLDYFLNFQFEISNFLHLIWRSHLILISPILVEISNFFNRLHTHSLLHTYFCWWSIFLCNRVRGTQIV